MAGQSGRSQQEDSVAVAQWEKEFFREVGSMDWDEMVQVRKSIHRFPDVMRWNDSAAKEAMVDAKSRYWAHKNRVACGIALPDPNMYIDEIDWDAKLDPLLVQEFEGARAVSDSEGDEDQVVQNSNPVLPPYTSVGWGHGGQAFQAPPAGSWGGQFNGWGIWPGANHAWQAWPNGPWHGHNVNGAWLGYSNYAPNMHESSARVYEPPQVSEERRNYPWRNGDGRRGHPYTRSQRQRRSTPRGSDAIQLTGRQSLNQE